MKSLVDTKRKFVIAKDKDDPYSNPKKHIGGLNVLSQAEKLPENVRAAQRGKIDALQQHFNVDKTIGGKWPELTGVYRRLYQDAGFKEDRMDALRK